MYGQPVRDKALLLHQISSWVEAGRQSRENKNWEEYVHADTELQIETPEAESAVCVQLSVIVSSGSKGQGHDRNISRSLRDGSYHVCGQGELPPMIFLSSFILPPEAECAHLFFLCYFQIRQPPTHTFTFIHLPLSSLFSSSSSSTKSCPGNLNIKKSLSSSCVSGWVF